MDKGDEVTLIPTEGGYQKPKIGVVTRVTDKRIVVRVRDSFREITFQKSTGEPSFKNDTEFPKYRLSSSN